MTNKDLKDGILPCPFCPCTDARVGRNGYEYYVFCHECHCEGPRKENRNEAIKAWNTRSTPAIADGVGVEVREFMNWIWERFSEGDNIDMFDVQEAFERYNLIDAEEATREDVENGFEGDEGDTIFRKSAAFKAFSTPPQAATDEG